MIIEKSPYVSLLVLSEVVYVLKGVYKIPKTEIVDSLMAISEEVQYEENELVMKTLENYKELNLDFVDCYLLARNQMNKDKVITFDKKLNSKFE